MAKISELTTLTAPITSSDLAMMIRPNSGGGYSSYKTKLNWFGELSSSSGGITASGVRSEYSSFLGDMMPSVFNGYGLTSTMTSSYGRSVVRVGAAGSLSYRGGVSGWNQGYEGQWGSGSVYNFVLLGTSRCPDGGVSELGFILKGATQGTRQGSGSYGVFPTASATVWCLNMSNTDQTPQSLSSTSTQNAAELDGASYHLQMAVITSSIGTSSLLMVGKTVGSVDEYSTSNGAGHRGIRIDQGSVYAPQSYQTRLGNFGLITYSDGNYSCSQSGHIRLSHDYSSGGCYLAFASGSSGVGGMNSYPSVTASAVLCSNGGDILITTGFPGFVNSARTIIFGSLSTTGSINSTGYINLPRGCSSGSLGISTAAEKMTGSMAFDTGSLQMVVFTGNGSTTYGGSTGWKVVTLS